MQISLRHYARAGCSAEQVQRRPGWLARVVCSVLVWASSIGCCLAAFVCWQRLVRVGADTCRPFASDNRYFSALPRNRDSRKVEAQHPVRRGWRPAVERLLEVPLQQQQAPADLAGRQPGYATPKAPLPTSSRTASMSLRSCRSVKRPRTADRSARPVRWSTNGVHSAAPSTTGAELPCCLPRGPPPRRPLRRPIPPRREQNRSPAADPRIVDESCISTLDK